jgi:hypothetical protein
LTQQPVGAHEPFTYAAELFGGLREGVADAQ